MSRFKEIRLKTGLNLTEFAKTLGIPFRTVQNWEVGVRECPKYVLNLIEEHFRHALEAGDQIKGKVLGRNGKMKQTIGTLMHISTADAEALINEALKYVDAEEEFETFKAEIGWLDWMNDFTDAADGEEATEEECKVIENVLEDAWTEAEERANEEPDKFAAIYGREILDPRSGNIVRVNYRGGCGFNVDERADEESEWLTAHLTEGEVEALLKAAKIKL